MNISGKSVEVKLDNILFATDFSRSVETAQLYVKALAERYGSVVQLMYVVDLGAAFKAPDAGISIDIFRRFGEESLRRLRSEMAAKNIRAETILCEGTDPTTEILRAAQDNSVDLLVLGTRAHKGLAKLVLGSTAELLIHRATCPILTIGPEACSPEEPLNFRKIVYATDFSAEAARAGAFTLSFARDFGAHIYFCHVSPAPDGTTQVDGQELNEEFTRALQQLVPDLTRERCEPECVLEHGYAADGILLLAHRVKADLIVLGTRLTSHWFDSFKAGVAFQVIGRAHCPVLTIRG
jgi:nucleotide-binding universal stress UspA family protein